MNDDIVNHIRVIKLKVLRGANIWAYCPMLETRVDIGKYEQLPSNEIPGFSERLAEALPGLWHHRCSEGRPGGFFERLREGTYMGHVLEHVILELQSMAGMEARFGKTRSTGRPNEYSVVTHYFEEEAAKLCVYLAIDLVESLAEDRELGFQLQQKLAEIRELAEDRMLGPSTQAIVDAAKRRGIPWFRLNGGALVQLGHGIHAKRIQASETSFTSNIAVEVASDKELTKLLLDRVGVPVPRGGTVTGADQACQVAAEIGYPVVVKPLDGNQGKAVSVNLTTEAQVQEAFLLACEHSDSVIVEQFLEGRDYRLLVIDGKLVAAAARQPAQVVADGIHSIRALVEMVNADPRRGSGHGAALTRINLDAASQITLAKQGYTPYSVPPAGVSVLLRDNSNLSTGGTASDVTADVHSDNVYIAELAASVIGLDVAGIDIVCRDIRKSLYEQTGGIVEVNAAPGLRMHVHPSEGRARPVGRAMVEMLFPNDSPARVPLIAVTGTNGKTTVSRMIGHIFSTTGKFVGMTSTDGIYFNGVRKEKSDASGPLSAEAVLMHPRVEVAVLETARGGILRSGLAWDRSDVSVVLNIATDHMGLDGVDTLEQLARVKRVIVESVSNDGYAVLNAEDQLVSDMARFSPGKVVFFGLERSGKVMRDHLADCGKAIYKQGNTLVLADGDSEIPLMNIQDIPATHGGVIQFQMLNAMAAAAACWAADVPLDKIRLGLRTFHTDAASAPGRFNMFKLGEADIIVDYGHNPHALRAVQQAISAIEPHRAIGVITAPGDRRDEDVRELAEIAASTFDWVILRQDYDLRGRQPGEVVGIMKDAITEAQPSLPVCVIEDELDATEQALEMARPGDLVVIFADSIDEVLERVKRAVMASELTKSNQHTSHVLPTYAVVNADNQDAASAQPETSEFFSVGWNQQPSLGE